MKAQQPSKTRLIGWATMYERWAGTLQTGRGCF